MGESFTGRKGATDTAQVPLQYMYCGLTNIMCAASLSIMNSVMLAGNGGPWVV